MMTKSGSPASKVQRTIDQYFDVTPLAEVKEFLIQPRGYGRMLFYDEDDGRSEKDCMWEGY